MSSGIYKIINIVSNKSYVGSAFSFNVRKNHHFSELRLNKHSNKHLQNAFNKYGENNFVFTIIEYVEDKNSILEREQFWIEELKVCNPLYGYNICTKAGNTSGRKLSNEHKQKLRIVAKNNKHALGYKHTKEAIEKIRESSRNREGSYGFLGHKHSEEVKVNLRYIFKGRPSPNKGNKHTEEAKNKISESQYKKVINLTTGEIFDSLKEAAASYPKTTRSSIGSVCTGRYKTASGCNWSYYVGELNKGELK